MKPAYVERARKALSLERRQIADERARLAREEQRLAQIAASIERDRQAWERERERTIVALRMICTRFGDLDWDETLPLDEIVIEHLADPLEDMAARVNRRLSRLSDGLALPRAAPSAPRPVGLATHRTSVERTADGFVPSCTCGWTFSATWTEGEALMTGRAHVDGTRADRSARRDA